MTPPLMQTVMVGAGSCNLSAIRMRFSQDVLALSFSAPARHFFRTTDCSSSRRRCAMRDEVAEIMLGGRCGTLGRLQLGSGLQHEADSVLEHSCLPVRSID